MRVIATRTLKDYINEFPQAEQALLSWHKEAELATWKSPNELKDNTKMYLSLMKKGQYLTYMATAIV